MPMPTDPREIFRIPDAIAHRILACETNVWEDQPDGSTRVHDTTCHATFFMKRTHPRLVNQWSTWEAP